MGCHVGWNLTADLPLRIHSMGNGLFIYRTVHTICRGFSIELDNSGISGTVEKSTSLVTLGSVADPHDLVTDCVCPTDPFDAYTPLQILPLLHLDSLLLDRPTLHTGTSRKKHHATGNPACRHHSDLLQSPASSPQSITSSPASISKAVPSRTIWRDL